MRTYLISIILFAVGSFSHPLMAANGDNQWACQEALFDDVEKMLREKFGEEPEAKYSLSANRYEVKDPLTGLFYFKATLENRMVHFAVQTRTEGLRSRYINASEQFKKMIDYFGIDNIDAVRLSWNPPVKDNELSDNLRMYNEAIAQFNTEYPSEEMVNTAASETWTGRQCKKLGFHHFVMEPDDQKPGSHQFVTGACFKSEKRANAKSSGGLNTEFYD